MTLKILTDDNSEDHFRSNIRSALDPNSRNLRMDPLNNDDKPFTPVTKSRHDSPCL
jgi:hypothetical protein